MPRRERLPHQQVAFTVDPRERPPLRCDGPVVDVPERLAAPPAPGRTAGRGSRCGSGCAAGHPSAAPRACPPGRPTARASQRSGHEAQGCSAARASNASAFSSTSGSAGWRGSRGRLTCSDTSLEATSRRYLALRELPERGSTIRVSTVRRVVEILGGEPEVRTILGEHGWACRPCDDSTTARPRRRGPRDVDDLPRPQAGHDRPDRLHAVPLPAPAGPPRGAAWPRAAAPSTRRSHRDRMRGSSGSRRATPDRARADAPAGRRRGRPGTGRTTS